MSSPLHNGMILVTGAAGFIGSALIWELNRRGFHNILACDYLQEGDKYKNLVPLNYADYMEADELLARVQQKDPALKELKTIFHLGACSSTTETDNRYLIENNYQYSKYLCSWALTHKSRFVYASSAATYGDGSLGMDDMNEDIQKLEPLNMYGYSKHLFDLFAQKNKFLNDIVGLKYFNVYGPNEHHKGDMRSLVHKAYQQITDKGQVSLFKSYKPEYKDGEQKRDFLYVKDAVNMTIHLAESKHAGGLFNLGSGQANTWVQLASAIFAALDLEPNIQFIDMPESLKAKYQYYTCAEIGKLRSSGYQENITPLDQAVKDYVQNYMQTGKYLGQ